MEKCCVVIITHKEKLEGDDEKSFKQALDIFNGNRDIKVVLPDNISYKYYDEYKNIYDFDVVKVSNKWLENYRAYNKMCCDKAFYDLFTDYEYILIYQTDCWVYEDNLDYFINLDFDWYGAPWPIYDDQVGNGGFSLRKVSKMIELTSKYTYDGRFHEDGWFCLTHKNDLSICDLDNACNFSMELFSMEYLKKMETYPMGLHDKMNKELWGTPDKFLEFKKDKLGAWRKISIVTVNLNNKDGLEKTINSVTSQTYFDKIEYVIIDGGSTDGSKELIEQHQKYLKHWCSEPDSGVYNAMNKGVDACNGDYVLFLNSGDYLHANNVLETIYNELDKDIVYGALMVHKHDGSTYMINDDYFLNKGIPHPSCFIKTDLLRNNKYREDYKIISDWIFFYEQININRVPYKRLKTIISDFFLGGLSSNAAECKREKDMYINSLSNVKIAMCSIGRTENKYAVEFVEFYYDLGVDKFFIYDNNYGDEEHFEDVLQPYIDKGIVEIIDYRDKSYCQVQSYQDCYDKHGDEYDWICFFDFDEFLWVSNSRTLKSLLMEDIYKGYEILHINELIYGDSGNIRYENKPMIERFKVPVQPIDYKKTFDFPENCHVKSIVRGGIKNLKWNGTPHTPTNNDLKCCNAVGEECKSNSPFVIPYVHKNIVLRHYKTKSLEEYYNTKVKRGYPDGNKDFFKKNNWVTEYFRENAVTKEKIDFINNEILLFNRITIIMPCYNYGHYIKEALDSLKASTFKNWSCIIVNDGSTDDSEKIILKEIGNDGRFTYVKRANKGLSATRNLAMRMVTSKYVMCLDPDDKISPTYIGNGIKYLDEHSDCVLYYGKAKMFYDDGSEKEWNLPEYNYKGLLKSNQIYSSFIMRKEEFDRTAGYDESMKGYEDWEFLVRFLYGDKKVYRTDDIVFYYRRHKGSMDASIKKDLKKYFNYISRKNKEIYDEFFNEESKNNKNKK